MGNKVENHIRQLGHKVYTRGHNIYDSTGKIVYQDNGQYYVKNSEGTRLYFTKNGKFRKVKPEEKGFWSSVGDALDSFSHKLGQANPMAQNAFMPPGTPRIVELAQISSGLAVRTPNGYRTYSDEDQKRAKKQLGILTAGAIAAPFVAEAVVTSAPYIAKGLNIAEQAMTPSTWIGGAAKAVGGQAPGWLLNGADLATSLYYGNKAKESIDREGLNWDTGFNAAMAMVPVTRSTEAINAVGNGVKGIVSKGKSVVDNFRNARKVVRGRGPLLNPRYKVSYSSTEGLNWDTPDVVTPEGVKLADGTLTKSTEGFDDLEKYFGQDHIKYNGNTTIYSHNGRRYNITQSPGKYVVTTPERIQIFSYPNDGDILSILNGKADARKGAQEFILNSRNNWINSLDDISQQVVRRQQTAPRVTVDSNNQADLSDRELVLEDGPIYDFIKNSVRSDIDNVYLSDTYIDRYMKSLGQDPKDLVKRSTISKILKRDLKHTDLINDLIYYQRPPNNGGMSSSDAFIYGINGNAGQDFLTKDNISSTIFHEFGHNLFGQNTSTGKYIRAYDTNLLKDDNPLDNLSMTADIMSGIDPNFKKHIDYLSKPTEFRQRVMEGVRYGILNGNLTPEQIYEQCKVPGFLGLKECFTKQYLIKMLGAMLGTAPVIINATNDKSS